MNKNLIFVGGMPRAGSTLLQAILDQNPEFHAGVASGLLETLMAIRNTWDKYVEHQAIPESVSTLKKKNVLAAIMDAYYAEYDVPYIFDKSRGWLAHIEMVEWVTEKPAKIIVPVRDLREILASFEILWRNTSKEKQVGQEMQNYLNMQTVADRCAMWMQSDQPVGLAYNRVGDALRRGYKDRLHFVPYEDLCNHPQATMNGIYEFLGLEVFDHDFKNITKAHSENDRVHGLLNLHTVQPAIRPVIMKANGILGADVAKKYAGKYPWESI